MARTGSLVRATFNAEQVFRVKRPVIISRYYFPMKHYLSRLNEGPPPVNAPRSWTVCYRGYDDARVSMRPAAGFQDERVDRSSRKSPVSSRLVATRRGNVAGNNAAGEIGADIIRSLILSALLMKRRSSSVRNFQHPPQFQSLYSHTSRECDSDNWIY